MVDIVINDEDLGVFFFFFFDGNEDLGVRKISMVSECFLVLFFKNIKVSAFISFGHVK